MDAVTYPEDRVVDLIRDHLIPVRIAFNHEPLSKDFNVKWTPTLITLDPDGKEHHRTVGFLDPNEFIASQLLGIGKALFDHERFDEAIAHFDTVIEKYLSTQHAPEAVYLRGVAQYKRTHNPKPLREAYDRLTNEFPDNAWTKRAYPYRLIG